MFTAGRGYNYSVLYLQLSRETRSMTGGGDAVVCVRVRVCERRMFIADDNGVTYIGHFSSLLTGGFEQSISRVDGGVAMIGVQAKKDK